VRTKANTSKILSQTICDQKELRWKTSTYFSFHSAVCVSWLFEGRIDLLKSSD
jgi:hypothetical protein